MPKYFQFTYQNLPLAVETIGNEWEQESINREQGYPYYHWLQTESGRGEILILNEKILLPKGHGILIKPFVPHAYSSEYCWKTNFVTFSGDLSKEIKKIVGNVPFLLAKESGFFSYTGWIDTMIQEHTCGQTDPISLSVACYSFLIHIAQSEGYQECQQNPLYLKYVSPVIKEIETNFSDNLTLEYLARKVYVSPQYLARLFRRFTGTSPYAYLQAVRLNHAKELLVNRPDLEIQHISYLIGIPNPSHFIAVFKKETGYTPLKFRALNQ